jgi:hypothetical protein
LFIDLAVILGVDDAFPLEIARQHLVNLLETLKAKPPKEVEPKMASKSSKSTSKRK